jgi:flagellin
MSDAGVISKVTAQENLEKIDNAINTINGNRANLGALQNRLQSTINNLEVKVENLSAANSRIRDTDVAFESAELTKNNILSASGVSVLAQANSSGQSALKLI